MASVLIHCDQWSFLCHLVCIGRNSTGVAQVGVHSIAITIGPQVLLMIEIEWSYVAII